MAVSRRIRFEVLRRDGHACRYCGAAAPDVKLTVDHVIPVALGGGDEPNNLVTACHDCNAGKSSTSPDERIVEDVDATALLFAKAMERASEARRHEIKRMGAILSWFEDMWDGIPMPSDWAQSVERFMGAGLDTDDLFRFSGVAFNSTASTAGVWRYFCGCCWGEIRDRQELARRLIEDGEV